MALSRAAAPACAKPELRFGEGRWPAAEVGIFRAFRCGDCHGRSSLLAGGARAVGLGVCSPVLKVSMTIMGPPQQGQGCLRVSAG